MINKTLKINRIILSLVIFLLVLSLIIMSVIFELKNVILVSTVIVALSILPFFLLIENRQLVIRKIVPIAIMTAVAICGRSAFFFVPQFKPIIAIIILCGLAFGCESGFLCGTMSMFISNFIFGHGPWTSWQMFACGIIGFVSGLFSKKRIFKNLIFLCIFGFLASLFYGVFVDIWTLIMLDEITISAALTILSMGLVFNLILAAATVIFLILAAKPFLKISDRIKLKYGI